MVGRGETRFGHPVVTFKFNRSDGMTHKFEGTVDEMYESSIVAREVGFRVHWILHAMDEIEEAAPSALTVAPLLNDLFTILTVCLCCQNGAEFESMISHMGYLTGTIWSYGTLDSLES